eukprot:m.25662 g.25662  ORF g.25662 m.25662 type:complete len:145 (-) comp11617_c0_seq1:597-1031(-)
MSRQLGTAFVSGSIRLGTGFASGSTALVARLAGTGRLCSLIAAYDSPLWQTSSVIDLAKQYNIATIAKVTVSDLNPVDLPSTSTIVVPESYWQDRISDQETLAHIGSLASLNQLYGLCTVRLLCSMLVAVRLIEDGFRRSLDFG